MLAAAELIAIQQRARAGIHPGKLKLGGMIKARLDRRFPDLADRDEAALEAYRYERARAEAELDGLEAEALALTQTADYNAGLEALGAALVSVDGQPATGLAPLLQLGTAALEAIGGAVAARHLEGKA